jgi:ubiquinone/menaquinone biosynthesis C-methylase UbiE
VFAQYAEYEWKDRDSWMPVERIFELAEVKKGSRVADIGCHEGYLTIHLAKTVGSEGHVYAVDVRQDRLEQLKIHLKDRNLNNVSVILGDYDNPKLPKNQLDAVIIMDTYHEMEDYKTILKHVHKSLKSGGKLIILEKLKKEVRNASRNEQTDAHTIAAKYVRKEIEAANFHSIKEINDLGNWENEDEKPMWLLVAEKPNKRH